jgi:hypothetical protein
MKVGRITKTALAIIWRTRRRKIIRQHDGGIKSGRFHQQWRASFFLSVAGKWRWWALVAGVCGVGRKIVTCCPRLQPQKDT